MKRIAAILLTLILLCSVASASVAYIVEDGTIYLSGAASYVCNVTFQTPFYKVPTLGVYADAGRIPCTVTVTRLTAAGFRLVVRPAVAAPVTVTWHAQAAINVYDPAAKKVAFR